MLAAHSAVRYVAIGGLSFLIDFGLVALLHEVAGLPVWLAAAAGFLASFVFNYFLQRMFSFGSRTPHGGALVRYSLLVGVNTLITVGIVTLLDLTVVGWAVGKVFATIVTTFGNYFAYRYWVFPSHRADPEEE